MKNNVYQIFNRSNNLFQIRMFAAPAKGGAPASQPISAKENYTWKSPIQKLIDNGTEMIMGPPPGHEKVY